MNNINCKPTYLQNGKDFVSTLNSFVKGDIFLAEHTLLFMFNSVDVSTENKIVFAKALLANDKLKDPKVIAFFQDYILQNTQPEKLPTIIEKVSIKIKGIFNKVTN